MDKLSENIKLSLVTSVSKVNYKFNQILFFFVVIMLINVVMAKILYHVFDDTDFSGLPPKKKDDNIFYNDRLVALFYYNSITLSTLGYGDIVPISNKARLFVGFYVALITAGLITAFELIN